MFSMLISAELCDSLDCLLPCIFISKIHRTPTPPDGVLSHTRFFQSRINVSQGFACRGYILRMFEDLSFFIGTWMGSGKWACCLIML